MFCSDPADQRRYQDRIDAADRRESQMHRAEQRIATEIEALVLMGLQTAKSVVMVPGVRQFADGMKSSATPLYGVIQDAVYDDGVMAAMREALAESKCPLVEALKVRLAKYIAEDRAPDLAELECGE